MAEGTAGVTVRGIHSDADTGCACLMETVRTAYGELGEFAADEEGCLANGSTD